MSSTAHLPSTLGCDRSSFSAARCVRTGAPNLGHGLSPAHLRPLKQWLAVAGAAPREFERPTARLWWDYRPVTAADGGLYRRLAVGDEYALLRRFQWQPVTDDCDFE